MVPDLFMQLCCWPFLGYFSFPPPSMTVFYPWYLSQAVTNTAFLCSFGAIATHSCAHNAQPGEPAVHTWPWMCLVCLQMDVLFPDAHGEDHTWARAPAVPSWEPQRCARGIILWVKRLYPLARCPSPQSVKGTQLASPGRGAKKEPH